MSLENRTQSQSFYLKLQPNRKMSVSIKYNQRKDTIENNQSSVKQMYSGFLKLNTDKRNSSFDEINSKQKQDNASVTQKQSLRSLLFSKKAYITEQNNQNYNTLVVTPRQNSIDVKHRRVICSSLNISQDFSNPKSYYLQQGSPCTNNQISMKCGLNPNSYESDLNFYESPMKSIKSINKNSKLKSTLLTPASHQRSVTQTVRGKRRFSNQLLHSVMNTLDKSRNSLSEKKEKEFLLNTKQHNHNINFSLDVLKDPNNQEFVPELKESLLNQDFLQSFNYFNKRFIEDNLKISLEIDRKIQYIEEDESSTASNVLMSISICQKTAELLIPYEENWKQIVKIQNKYTDRLYQNRNASSEGQKYIIPELIYSPYDLFIIIEDISSTIQAVQFLINNSYQHDRVSFVFLDNGIVSKTPLLACTKQNKQYLKNTLSGISASSISQDQVLSLFDATLQSIQERSQTNFLTSVFWFTQGVNYMVTKVIQQKSKEINQGNPFQINIFEYNNVDIKSNIQNLAFQSHGSYFLLTQSQFSKQIIPIVTEAICSLKRTIGFKCSGMIRNVTQLEYSQQLKDQKQKIILPKIKVINRYGGKRVWKEDNLFQGNSIAIPYIQYDSDYSFNIKYSFEFDQPFKQYQIESLTASLLKVVCLTFSEQRRKSEYIFKETKLDATFKKQTVDNSLQNENNLNPKIVSSLLKFEVINQLLPIINVKDLNYIQKQIYCIETHLKNLGDFNSLQIQQEKQRMVNCLEEIKYFVTESTALNCNKIIENIIHSLINQKTLLTLENPQ